MDRILIRIATLMMIPIVAACGVNGETTSDPNSDPENNVAENEMNEEFPAEEEPDRKRSSHS